MISFNEAIKQFDWNQDNWRAEHALLCHKFNMVPHWTTIDNTGRPTQVQYTPGPQENN